MTMPWDGVIPQEDLDVYAKAGFGNRLGIGARPAVLVIDVQYRTVGDEPAPVLEAIDKYYSTACGEVGWKAVHQIARLLEAARARDIPVLYPHVAPKTAVDARRGGMKNAKMLTVADRGYDFVAEIAPQEGDILIPKRHPSGFFGTPLASYLIDRGIDTLIITGCTTSGCVRATTVDASSLNFRVTVPYECVYDRGIVSHQVSLFDMHSKYADVVSLDNVLEQLNTPKVPAAAS